MFGACAVAQAGRCQQARSWQVYGGKGAMALWYAEIQQQEKGRRRTKNGNSVEITIYNIMKKKIATSTSQQRHRHVSLEGRLCAGRQAMHVSVIMPVRWSGTFIPTE